MCDAAQILAVLLLMGEDVNQLDQLLVGRPERVWKRSPRIEPRPSNKRLKPTRDQTGAYRCRTAARGIDAAAISKRGLASEASPFRTSAVTWLSLLPRETTPRVAAVGSRRSPYPGPRGQARHPPFCVGTASAPVQRSALTTDGAASRADSCISPARCSAGVFEIAPARAKGVRTPYVRRVGPGTRVRVVGWAALP